MTRPRDVHGDQRVEVDVGVDADAMSLGLGFRGEARLELTSLAPALGRQEDPQTEQMRSYS
jgi:hypothetical protein